MKRIPIPNGPLHSEGWRLGWIEVLDAEVSPREGGTFRDMHSYLALKELGSVVLHLTAP